MNFFKQSYEKLWRSIIRPPRTQYQISDLGPDKFRINERAHIRQDFQVLNQRKLRLKCSLFRKKQLNTEDICLIYMHGNTGSRIFSIPMVKQILSHNMSFVAFDFTACGLSEGDYISLGHFEQYDIKAVIEYLQSEKQMKNFILWGRSMGAVASIFHQANYNKCKGLIVDSPYCDFQKLVFQIAQKNTFLPTFLAKIAINYLRQTFIQKIGVDLLSLKPIDVINKIKCPIYFLGSKDDEIVDISHLQQLYQQCKLKRKELKIVSGNHNQRRSEQLQRKILHWITKSLNMKESKIMFEESEFDELSIASQMRMGKIKDLVKSSYKLLQQMVIQNQ